MTNASPIRFLISGGIPVGVIIISVIVSGPA